MNDTTYTYICSFDPDSSPYFEKDLKHGANSHLLEKLDERSWLCETLEDFRSPFCLHRFAVQDEWRAEETSIETIAKAHLELNFQELEDCDYAIQLSANQKLPWSFGQLIPLWQEHFGLIAKNRNNRKPQRVLSCHFQVNEDRLRLFSGIAEVNNNLSPWSRGVSRIPREKNSVSRAENKLFEALELVDLPPGKNRRALDLGAAPGGWSRVLANLGYDVDAIDPAPLHPNLKHHRKIHYHSTTAGVFLKRKHKPYDLIVCDMKMKSVLAAKFISDYQNSLKENGFLILTLKLPKGQSCHTDCHRALNIIRKAYTLVQARQLYFNRQEITVIAKPLHNQI